MRVIRKSDMKEGRWRNGMGVSWDIAAVPEGSSDAIFGWRFALALIAQDVPFSHYPETDRVFTLVRGEGLDLTFEGHAPLAVDGLMVPHAYPCDIPTFCRLRNGPCLALNLFLRRGVWTAAVDIVQGSHAIRHAGPILLYALDGPALVDGHDLASGDAALLQGAARLSAGTSHLYVARLSR